jgi:hypothetical protein
MTPNERDARLQALEAVGRRMQANVVCRLVAPPPDLATFPMAGPGSTYDPGDAFGWRLPNGLVLFLWATPPYPPLTSTAEMRNPLSGFIGVPGGYDEGIGRAVPAPPGEGPLGGLPLVWGWAWGSPLPFRCVGPVPPAGQAWFIFVGGQNDLDELFRRAHAFASGYTGLRQAEPGAAPGPRARRLSRGSSSPRPPGR